MENPRHATHRQAEHAQRVALHTTIKQVKEMIRLDTSEQILLIGK